MCTQALVEGRPDGEKTLVLESDTVKDIAAGAIVFTSQRAEGIARHMHNAIVLEKYTAEEIQFYVNYLRMHPEKREMLRASAR